MLGILDVQNQRRVDLNSQDEGQLNQRLTELLVEILRQINETRKMASSQQHDNDQSQEIIFKTTIGNACYTLLYSAKRPEEHVESPDLSPRELEIVRLTARGLSNKAVAAVLEISPWTVNTYIRRIFVKLNVNNRVEMVAVATQQGLLNLNSEIRIPIEPQGKNLTRQIRQLVNQFIIERSEAPPGQDKD